MDFVLGEVDLEQIRSFQIGKIKNMLVKYPGNKVVVLDKDISNMFDYIFTPSNFKSYGVEEMFYTTNFAKLLGKYYIYFVLPTNESITFMNKNKDFLINSMNKHIVCFVGTRNIDVEYRLHHNFI
jgi:hypothetical protein